MSILAAVKKSLVFYLALFSVKQKKLIHQIFIGEIKCHESGALAYVFPVTFKEEMPRPGFKGSQYYGIAFLLHVNMFHELAGFEPVLFHAVFKSLPLFDFDFFAQAGEILWQGKPDKDSADRFFSRSAGGTCNAGNGQPKMAFGGRADSACHLADCWRADSPESFEDFFLNAQQIMFDLIAVGEHAALKPAACSAYLGNGGSQQSAGAGFSNSKAHFELRQDNAEFMAYAGAHAVKIKKGVFCRIFGKAGAESSFRGCGHSRDKITHAKSFFFVLYWLKSIPPKMARDATY